MLNKLNKLFLALIIIISFANTTTTAEEFVNITLLKNGVNFFLKP